MEFNSLMLMLVAILFLFISDADLFFRRRRRRRCSRVNCRMSNWSSWSACTQPCKGGIQLRTRSITRAASCGGSCSYTVSEIRHCNTGCCPRNCVVSWWSSWRSCSVSCGGGQRTRSRSIIVSRTCGGQTCPYLTQTQKCNDFCCRKDCIFKWSHWSAQCNCHGQYTARLIVIQKNKCGGNSCPNKVVKKRNCQWGSDPARCYGGKCNPSTGVCDCNPGLRGKQCDQKCPYDKTCSNQCLCGVGKCDKYNTHRCGWHYGCTIHYHCNKYKKHRNGSLQRYNYRVGIFVIITTIITSIVIELSSGVK